MDKILRNKLEFLIIGSVEHREYIITATDYLTYEVEHRGTKLEFETVEEVIDLIEKG
ncbi:MAG: hypothetical protein ACRCZO_15315 [Cetobacterium sp.]